MQYKMKGKVFLRVYWVLTDCSCMPLKLQLYFNILSLKSGFSVKIMETHLLFSTVYICLFQQKVLKSHSKTACSCKKIVRPSKSELTATKSNDIIMRPCARCASCKINIS